MPMSKGTEVLPADPAAILEAARAIGFPVLVKPAGGTRLIGPNCLGIYTPRGKVTFTEIAPKETGTVGVVSQSGGLGTDIIRRGMSRSLKFSGLVTVGNCADVTPFDRASVDELAALKLPPGTSITNPVDCPVGTLQQEQGRVAEKILDVIYRSGKPDALVMHLNLSAFVGRTKPEVLDNLVKAALRARIALPVASLSS